MGNGFIVCSPFLFLPLQSGRDDKWVSHLHFDISQVRENCTEITNSKSAPIGTILRNHRLPLIVNVLSLHEVKSTIFSLGFLPFFAADATKIPQQKPRISAAGSENFRCGLRKILQRMFCSDCYALLFED